MIVTIQKRRGGYVSTITGVPGVTHRYVRAGLTPYEAACSAIHLLDKAEGGTGTIVAPYEVKRWIPDKLSRAHQLDDMRAAAQDLLQQLDGMPSLFQDDERFCEAYRRLQELVEENNAVHK